MAAIRRPLAGDVAREDGATRALVAETATIAAFAKTLGDGRLALLGHSMASDIVVRAALADPAVGATIAVSMFSRMVTATEPRDLLVIVGALEGGLRQEALRAVGLATPDPPQPGTTYGRLADGTARRAVFARFVEHVGVLYSQDSLGEAVFWLDGAFGLPARTPPEPARRGLWILALLGGIILLAWPLAGLLPAATGRPAGAGLPWRRLWPILVVPAIATPLLLRLAPTERIGVPVGGYLAAHFALYGLIGWAMLTVACRGRPLAPAVTRPASLVLGATAFTGYCALTLGWAIDAFVTSLVPGGARLGLFAAMLAGTAAFFTADEWATRGGARGGAAAAKLAFLGSLGLAIALDPRGLFFLVVILPVIVPAFLVFGAFGAWTYRSTRHPLVAAAGSAIAFAWALASTFPILAG